MADVQSFMLDVEAGHLRKDITNTVHLPDATPLQGVNKNGDPRVAEFTFTTAQDMEDMTVAIQYTTTTQEEQRANVSLIGEAEQHVVFLPSQKPDVIAITSVQIAGKIPKGVHSLKVTGQGEGSPLLVVKGLIIPTT